jgi:hypothetical protein
MMLTTRLRTSWTATATALSALQLLVACGSLPTSAPAAPELQLVAAGELSLPGGCEPSSGTVYRVSYVVEPDGRVADAAPDSGTGCVQDALRRWVESFQYLPLAGPLPATIDWMAVSAVRGG